MPVKTLISSINRENSTHRGLIQKDRRELLLRRNHDAIGSWTWKPTSANRTTCLCANNNNHHLSKHQVTFDSERRLPCSYRHQRILDLHKLPRRTAATQPTHQSNSETTPNPTSRARDRPLIASKPSPQTNNPSNIPESGERERVLAVPHGACFRNQILMQQSLSQPPMHKH
jgi:hypothetical protein